MNSTLGSRFLLLVTVASGEQSVPNEKLVGGLRGTLSDFAFVAAIIRCDSNYPTTCWQSCSGSLISPNVVMTAGHCVRPSFSVWGDDSTDVSVSNLKVLLGSSNWMNLESTALFVDVKSIAFSTYGMNIRFPLDGDIALIELNQCIGEIPGAIEYARLATWQSEPDRSSGCVDVTVAGYGISTNLPSAIAKPDDGQLRFITDNLQSADVCREAYTALIQGTDYPDFNSAGTDDSGAVLSENILCSGGASVHSTCNGDSGGPVFTRLDNGRAHVVGITSFGFGGSRDNIFCSIGPDFSTRVAFHNDWIADKLANAFAQCDGWAVDDSFATSPLEAYPSSSLSDLWRQTRCNASSDPILGKWQCLNGECIDSGNVCDGTPNCSDDSDETTSGLCRTNRRRLSEVSVKSRKPIFSLRHMFGMQKSKDLYVPLKEGISSAEPLPGCSDAVVAVNSAISIAQSHYTDGDSYWDPTECNVACAQLNSCSADSTDTTAAQSFCDELDFFNSMTDTALQNSETFGTRFNAACSDDAQINSLTDLPTGTDAAPTSGGLALNVFSGLMTVAIISNLL